MNSLLTWTVVPALAKTTRLSICCVHTDCGFKGWYFLECIGKQSWKHGLLLFVTSWWTKILNRELVLFFIWIAVICRGKSNLLSLCALWCRCQAVGCWLSEPWTQLWWPLSAWPQQLFALLLPLPTFYFVSCFWSLLGQKMWDFWDGILNFSKQDHSEGHAAHYVYVLHHVLQLFFSTTALGR